MERRSTFLVKICEINSELIIRIDLALIETLMIRLVNMITQDF